MQTPCLFLCGEPVLNRGRMRLVGMLAAGTILGLGTAGPALASDDVPPEPPQLVLPAAVSPDVTPEPIAFPTAPAAVPEPPPPPAPDPPQLVERPIAVAVTQDDAGNVNASIRVLSPGTDEPIPPTREPSGAVSDVSQPDITTASDPLPASASGRSDTSPGSDLEASSGAGSTTPDGRNTNVSVRVLSPGDNGPVSQSTRQTATAGNPEQGTEPGSPSDSTAATNTAASDSGQYQHNDSQYQSESQSIYQSWHWVWSFDIDCAGNANSSSAETGSPGSLVWVWDWTWNWTCVNSETADPRAVFDAVDSSLLGGSKASSSDPSQPDGPRSITSSQPAEPGSAPPAARSEPASEPWTWIWSFTFCGETTSIALQSPSATALDWTWAWTWNWTCDGQDGAPTAGGVGPLPDVDTAPLASPTPDTPTVPDPLAAPSSFVQHAQDPLQPPPPLPSMPAPPAWPALPDPTSAIVPAVGPEDGMPILVAPPAPSRVLSVPSSVFVVVRAGGSPDTAPSSTRAAPGSTVAHTSPADAAVGSVAPVPQPGVRAPRLQQPALATPVRPQASKPAEPRVRRASPRPAHRPLAPIRPPLAPEVASSGTSGGLVPSAPVSVVAALVGFFMLAAPPLGQRIRVARELRPRSGHRSPIDDPG